MHFSIRTLTQAVAIGALVSASGLAAALDDQDHPPMGGPRVKDGGVPGEHRRFADHGEERRGDRSPPMMHRAFMHALDVLRGDEAGANKLTADQDARIKAINDEFRAKGDAFREAHKAEVRALIKDLPEPDARRARGFLMVAREFYREDGPTPGERPGGARRGERGPEGRPKDGPGRGDMPPTKGEDRKPSPEAEKARERLHEILKDAPKLEDVHAQLFGVLTADQRAMVEKELAHQREQAEARRGEMMERRGQGPEGEPRERMLEKLTPEQREKLRSMTPEQRREFIRSLREKKDDPGK